MSHVWMISILQISTFILLIVVLSYKYLSYHYGKWKQLGVPHVEPSPPFGNLADTSLGRVHIAELLQSLYNRFHDERYFGLYEGRLPSLVLRDPKLIFAILIKDFTHFTDRTPSNVSFVHDKLFEHLFNMRGEKWKLIRAKLSPTFTAMKLKSMLTDIDDCKGPLINSLSEQMKNNNGIVDINEVAARFTIDVIGRCAFGLDCNSLAEPDSDFRRTGRELFTTSPRSITLNFVRQIGLGRYLDVFRIRDKPDHIYDFFDNMLETTMEQHKSGENTRNDFIALLVKLVNEEKLNESEKKLFTDEVIAANTFVFFIAGFETTSLTISYCLYELAKRQDIQAKLREQIQQILNENDGKLSYDSLKDMKYFKMVIDETLRLHPPAFLLKRVCTKRYTIPDSNITLNVGQRVVIPTYALHHDSEYYPNPDVFDPERFTEENISSRPRGTYLPFGDGPRICIGLRFVIMEVKTGIAEILSKFELYPCEDTPTRIKLKMRSISTAPEKPIHLLFKKIV